MHEGSPAEFLRWIVLLPLIGFAINGLLNKRLPRAVSATVGVGSVAGAFVLSVMAFLKLRALPADERVLVDHLFSWIPVGELNIDAGLMVDPLSACMILLVTGVGSLIHLYSVGYMAKDEGFARFFAYLNLFVFAMLVLVLADSLPLLFVGWEGVGLCSYLLIGFWFQDLANSAAGKKAFVVNRVGDFGFLLGMFFIAEKLAGQVGDGNVLGFATMAAHPELLAPVATVAGLLLFLGATGKSAQIPLYVWLPDAMAGPTPVSALIHAATMVTAGVYMIARMNFLYVQTEVAMGVIAVVGLLTALVAATIALVQTDIKKVLAYSTVSQLGYMMLACGVGAFAVGIFHVLTHAFFKALLFLGAGSVIHAMHHEQDMRSMGGLRSVMPWTFRTMFVATLAIAGVFPFAGFFSKDEILYKAFLESPLLWVVGFAVAALTAFYMARLMVMTFFGENRADANTKSHLHESPLIMTAPLMVLAVLSVVGGWMGWPEFLGGSNWLHHWLEPVFAGVGAHGAEVVGHVAGATQGVATHAVDASHAADALHTGGHSVVTEWVLALASLSVALGSLWFGFTVYTRRQSVATQGQAFLGGAPHRLLSGKYFVDELYEYAIIRPIGWLSDNVLWRFVDAVIIDGLLVNGVARFLAMIGHVVRILQNGLVRWYAYSFAVGVFAMLIYLTRKGG